MPARSHSFCVSQHRSLTPDLSTGMCTVIRLLMDYSTYLGPVGSPCSSWSLTHLLESQISQIMRETPNQDKKLLQGAVKKRCKMSTKWPQKHTKQFAHHAVQYNALVAWKSEHSATGFLIFPLRFGQKQIWVVLSWNTVSGSSRSLRVQWNQKRKKLTIKETQNNFKEM